LSTGSIWFETGSIWFETGSIWFETGSIWFETGSNRFQNRFKPVPIPVQTGFKTGLNRFGFSTMVGLLTLFCGRWFT
jgi:hypothetical protein